MMARMTDRKVAKGKTAPAKSSRQGTAKVATQARTNSARKSSTKNSTNSSMKESTKNSRKSSRKISRKSSTKGSSANRTAGPAAGRSLAARSPSRLIDGRIKELGDWRGETLSRLRDLIKHVIPDVVEEWKWRGVPVWYHDGMLCTGETYKDVVKVTFARGAALPDPGRLFNSSLEGNVRRAIDFREGEKLDDKALKTLLRAAADLNSRPSTARGKGRD
jgi:hypothetical protein